MSDYYGDNDTGACAWLRELIREGLIPEGVVDERDIRAVEPGDLVGYRRHHFFAGVAGWSLALQFAGWPEDRPVVTASLPCQPFSSAGKRKGEADERHLWPVFFRLVQECRFPVLLGEQVGSAAGYEWLAGVHADMASEGYLFGAADLPAAGVSAPHVRQRLFWVAYADGGQPGDGGVQPGREHGQQPADSGVAGRLGDALGEGRQGRGTGVRGGPVDRPGGESPGSPGDSRWLDDAASERAVSGRPQEPEGDRADDGVSGASGPWSDYDIIPCRDGKVRRIPRRLESRLQRLADGSSAGVGGVWTPGDGVGPLAPPVAFPGRVGLLRGFGNCIVVQVAAKFIRAFLDAERELA